MAIAQISQLPTRYETLVERFGIEAQTTFITPEQDLIFIKKLIQSIKGSNQSKILFISGRSGQGKTTFIHSLPLFVGNDVRDVVRLPPEYEMSVRDVVKIISEIERRNYITVVNFDGRETPSFDETEYKNFLIQLNALLRSRPDLLIVWPVNDARFAEKIVALLQSVAGKSAFGTKTIHEFSGIPRDMYVPVLEKINKVANWKLEDAALSMEEVTKASDVSVSVGDFLDHVQQLIVERFDVSSIGTNIPKLVFSLSSGKKEVKELCRSVRRADSFYLEASRLLMYTKRSNVADWWEVRNKDINTNLNYIIALFNAELVSISGSSVVHAVRNFGDEDLKQTISEITKNIGNAKRVVRASELYKFSVGQSTDAREYGLSVNDETLVAYQKIQALSKTRHAAINRAIFSLLAEAEGGFLSPKFEKQTGSKTPIQTDLITERMGEVLHLEFHHKAETETTPSRVSIYILEKIKEYAIAYGLCPP